MLIESIKNMLHIYGAYKGLFEDMDSLTTLIKKKNQILWDCHYINCLYLLLKTIYSKSKRHII